MQTLAGVSADTPPKLYVGQFASESTQISKPPAVKALLLFIDLRIGASKKVAGGCPHRNLLWPRKKARPFWDTLCGHAPSASVPAGETRRQAGAVPALRSVPLSAASMIAQEDIGKRKIVTHQVLHSLHLDGFSHQE
jgi:hypothetical protein